MKGPHSDETRRKISKERKKRFAAGLIHSWNEGKHGLQVAWNKGLTKKTDKRVAKYANKLVGHGMSKAGRKKMSVSAKKRATHASMMHVVAVRNLRWAKIGHPRKGKSNPWMVGRKPNPSYKHFRYNGRWMHSSWEVAFAMWCRANKIQYRYEPECFRLKPAPGRGWTYTPDFYLPELNLYVDPKPFEREYQAKKIKRFRKEFPDKELCILGPALMTFLGLDPICKKILDKAKKERAWVHKRKGKKHKRK